MQAGDKRKVFSAPAYSAFSLSLSLFNPREKLFGKSKPCCKYLEEGKMPALPLTAVA